MAETLSPGPHREGEGPTQPWTSCFLAPRWVGGCIGGKGLGRSCLSRVWGSWREALPAQNLACPKCWIRGCCLCPQISGQGHFASTLRQGRRLLEGISEPQWPLKWEPTGVGGFLGVKGGFRGEAGKRDRSEGTGWPGR